MVNIIVASHGPMAEAMVKSSQMLYGESDFVKAVCLQAEDSVEVFAERLKNVIEPYKEVLLLVDIPGGTPSNQGMLLAVSYEHLRVVSGVNLMMLLECLIRAQTTTVDELKEIAMKSSVESIREMKITNVKQDEIDTLFD